MKKYVVIRVDGGGEPYIEHVNNDELAAYEYIRKAITYSKDSDRPSVKDLYDVAHEEGTIFTGFEHYKVDEITL